MRLISKIIGNQEKPVSNSGGEVLTPNQNLLINPWFTVNQRGFTSSSGSAGIYTTDHWYILTDGGTGGSTSINADGSMHLVAGSANNGIQNVVEVANYESEFQGKKVTLSVRLKNGTLYNTTTDALPARTSSNVEVLHEEVTTGLTLILMVAKSSAWYAFQARIVVTAGSTFDLRAVKLEIGSVSTLHLDTAPDYTTELLKCRRYYLRIKAIDANTGFGLCDCYTTTDASLVLPIPTEMRARPTVSYSGTINIFINGSDHIVTSVTFGNQSTTSINLVLTASGLIADSVGLVRLSKADQYIALDAEL